MKNEVQPSMTSSHTCTIWLEKAFHLVLGVGGRGRRRGRGRGRGWGRSVCVATLAGPPGTHGPLTLTLTLPTWPCASVIGIGGEAGCRAPQVRMARLRHPAARLRHPAARLRQSAARLW